jgi:hypothetical protein
VYLIKPLLSLFHLLRIYSPRLITFILAIVTTSLDLMLVLALVPQESS